MTTRNLEEVEQRISDVRSNIDRQRNLIHNLQAGGGTEDDIAMAEDLLRALEQSLFILRERRTHCSSPGTSPARNLQAGARRDAPPI